MKMITSNDATATATTATATTAIATISTSTEPPPLKRRRLRTLSEGENEGESESEDSVTDNDETPPTRMFSFQACGCADKNTVRPKLIKAMKRSIKDTGLVVKDLELLTPAFVAGLCWSHLRDFCTSVGMRTQVGGRKTLTHRVDTVRQARFRLGIMKTDPKYAEWFTKSFRGAIPEDALGVLRFLPTPEIPFSFDAAKVLERYAGGKVDGGTAADVWEKDGTVIVRGVLGWLFEDPEIVNLIEEEVHMYIHHRRRMGGISNYGWLQSAFFTQIQQIARQDLVYYALVAATSGSWWQVSFPYYMKATLPGDGTYFQHLDLNLTNYMAYGRGARRVQTSCTLT